MIPLSYTDMQFDLSIQKSYTETHHCLQQLVYRDMPFPSAQKVSDMIQRTLHRTLVPLSLSGNEYQNISTGEDASECTEVRFENCTLHSTRLICASFSAHTEALSSAANRLGPGDIVVLESLDLSTGHCFPYHSAFGRFQEILSLYQNAIRHPTTYEEMRQLRDTLTSDSTIHMGVPVKLHGDQRSMPGSVLDCIRPGIQMTGMISVEEFDTVTAELKRIGRDDLISINSFTINRILFSL